MMMANPKSVPKGIKLFKDEPVVYDNNPYNSGISDFKSGELNVSFA
jgi:hypothetical protein